MVPKIRWRGTRILYEELTQIGCRVAHGYWKARDSRSPLLGGGFGVRAGGRSGALARWTSAVIIKELEASPAETYDPEVAGTMPEAIGRAPLP